MSIFLNDVAGTAQDDFFVSSLMLNDNKVTFTAESAAEDVMLFCNDEPLRIDNNIAKKTFTLSKRWKRRWKQGPPRRPKRFPGILCRSICGKGTTKAAATRKMTETVLRREMPAQDGRKEYIYAADTGHYFLY